MAVAGHAPHHVAGDKLFVDYSGKRQEICGPLTGEVRMAEIFLAVLGASNYTFAEVTWSQTLFATSVLICQFIALLIARVHAGDR